jgi:hypothetical protein
MTSWQGEMDLAQYVTVAKGRDHGTLFVETPNQREDRISLIKHLRIGTYMWNPLALKRILMICTYGRSNSTNEMHVFFDYEQCSIMIVIGSRWEGQIISSSFGSLVAQILCLPSGQTLIH